jgi:hypothetical protein
MRAFRSAGSKRTRFLVALAGAGAIALIASAAWAVIPDASGTIHACYAQDGVLRVVDSEAGQRCKKNERSLDWETAPAPAPEPELPDSFVALRTQEVPLPQGRTVIAALELQPGKYEVTGKVFLFNSSSEVGPVSGVSCQLTPSNEDGSPGNSGGPPADPGHLALAPSGEPGSAGTIGLGVSQVLTETGSVVLDCYNHDPSEGSAPVASNAWIRAIEVGSITTNPGVPPLP